MSDAPLLQFTHATVRRGERTFTDLDWAIREGETWAVTGPVASGKSMLVEAIVGRIHADGISYPLVDRLVAAGRPVEYPSDVITRVSFKEESRLFSYSRHYYQQRFNFIEKDDDLSLDQFLTGGKPVDEVHLAQLCEQFHIGHLRPQSLITLSNGQTRRSRLVKALLQRPHMLILDDPFMGLDAVGRDELSDLLGRLVREGLHLILVTRPDAIPAWVTHVLELDDLHVVRKGPWRPQPVEEVSTRTFERVRSGGRPVIDLRDVHVAYGDRILLDGITWTVRAGERWALLGPNGSGKSTLLSMIAADHPRVYSNHVHLFGRQRGTGESIWDVKRGIGLVSPEMHLYFSEPLTATETIATGFFDVLARRPISAAQSLRINELLAYFDLLPLADRLFNRLSTGEQRMILLMRALVKRPPLLILDEPFQGLDDRLIGRLQHYMADELTPEQALIFVTHHLSEIPACVTRCLRLERGRSV